MKRNRLGCGDARSESGDESVRAYLFLAQYCLYGEAALIDRLAWMAFI
jgi:hypothetical protein